jgi:hypothetical protein
MDAGQVPNVAGRVLPGGHYRIAAEENRRLCEALYTTATADGTAHAIYAYIATQSGMGLTVDGLLAWCEFDAAEGPMLGSSNTRYLHPIRTDQTYRISGEILGLTRKNSRKLGTIDILEYRLAMDCAAGERILEVVNTWILPRRHLSA